MFDPTIGRWTTEDPIGFEAADADLFRYVHNNPTNATDPTGTTIRDVEFHGRLSGEEKKRIQDTLNADDRAVYTRLVDVIAEIDSALKKPQPRGAPNRYSAQAVVARLREKGGVFEDKRDNDPAVVAFIDEYEWALSRTKAKLMKIRTEMDRRYIVGYWAYGEKHPKDGYVLDERGSRGFVHSGDDDRLRRIHITQARFDLKHPDIPRIIPERDRPEALAVLRRGTMLHELSHLVWNTVDYYFTYTRGKAKDNASIKWRFLDDAYWYGSFYQTSSMRDDFNKNIDFLIKDITRKEYLDWLVKRGADWNGRHPDTKTNPDLADPPRPRP